MSPDRSPGIRPAGARVGAFCVGALLAAAGIAQESGVPAPGGAWVRSVRVTPTTHRGPCPVGLAFEGEIQKGAWGLVEYHWERSDGVRTPAAELDFPIQGEFRGSPVKRVAMRWRVAPEPGEEIWAELVIDSPETVRSEAARATARVDCTPNPCAAMAEHGPVTSLVQQCAAWRFAEAKLRLAERVESFAREIGPDPSDAPDSVLRQVAVKRLAAFRASQEAWEEYRKEACQEVYLETFPGSSATARRLDCLRELSEERLRYLERRRTAAE